MIFSVLQIFFSMIDSFAVNNFKGLAKLIISSEPFKQSEGLIRIAFGSEYSLLVIWHNIKSEFFSDMIIRAGLSLKPVKSENGNLTNTISPTVNAPMLCPLPGCPTHCEVILRLPK